MATMIPCPACKKKIAGDAKVCPKCGHEMTEEERAKALKDAKAAKIGCLGLFVVLVVIGLAVDSCDKDKTQSKPEPASVETTTSGRQKAPVIDVKPITADELRAQVASLLAELDAFKDSSEFRQCVYGCQQGSMGKEWNRKREALQERVTPETNAPILLKAAPGELWALGMAYAKGKAEEARELRADIEKALAR